MIASAPKSTALFTFSISASKSMLSLEVPRFTLILVVRLLPTPLGTMDLCTLLHGMMIWPFAIRSINFSGAILSFFATASISGVKMPFLAASICVAYSILLFPFLLSLLLFFLLFFFCRFASALFLCFFYVFSMFLFIQLTFSTHVFGYPHRDWTSSLLSILSSL